MLRVGPGCHTDLEKFQLSFDQSQEQPVCCLITKFSSENVLGKNSCFEV